MQANCTLPFPAEQGFAHDVGRAGVGVVRVLQPHHQIRLARGLERPPYPLLLHMRGCLADTCRIRDDDSETLQIEPHVDHVARRASFRRNDGRLAPR